MALTMSQSSSSRSSDIKNKPTRHTKLQRQWIQLIDSWSHLTFTSQHRVDDQQAVALMEQISHTAQRICRDVQDPTWLVTAFQLAISAVLVDPQSLKMVPPSILLQLGQQLVQLAIHSVVQPYLEQITPGLSDLTHQPVQPESNVAHLLVTLNELKHLSSRLLGLQSLESALHPDQLASIDLYTLLLQDTHSLMMSITLLENPCQVVRVLLESVPAISIETFPFRLSILENLINSRLVSLDRIDQEKLLIGYKDNQETGLWVQTSSNAGFSASPHLNITPQDSLENQPPTLLGHLLTKASHAEQQPHPLDANKLLGFYLKQLNNLDTQTAVQLADLVLHNVQVERNDPTLSLISLKRIQLSTKALVSCQCSKPDRSIGSVEPDAIALDLLQALTQHGHARNDSQSWPTNAADTLQRFKDFKSLPENEHVSLTTAILQLIDTKSQTGLDSRIHAVSMIKLLSEPSYPLDGFGIAVSDLAHLLVAVLYANSTCPLTNTINVTTSQADLDLFVHTASCLSLPTSPSDGHNDTFWNELAQLFNFRPEPIPVSASQIYIHANRCKTDRGLLQNVQLHLKWLQRIHNLTQNLDSSHSKEINMIHLGWLLVNAGPSGSAEAQRDALDKLVQAYSSQNIPSPSVSRDRDLDVVTLRFRAKWTDFFHTAIDLVDDPSGPFSALFRIDSIEVVLGAILRTGDIDLFRSIAADSLVAKSLTNQLLEHLVLSVSTSLYDSASVASMRDKEIKLANDVLDAVSASTSIKLQRNFIEATCRLCSFRVKSKVDTTKTILPAEVRATPDRMDLIARLLANQEDAYKSPELILEIATKLSALGPGFAGSARPETTVHDNQDQDCQVGLTSSEKTMVEIRTLAMLIDTATSASDFDDAAAFSLRLVDKIGILRKRADAQQQHLLSSTSSSPSLLPPTARAGTAASILPEALELGWKTCFQLGKHPGWDDTPSRLTILSHALTLCPVDRLPSMLQTWRNVDSQLLAEIDSGKQFASTKKTTSGWLPLGLRVPSGVRLASGSQNAAAVAASVGAGLVGLGANAAANLLPLTFTPLSSYFSSSSSAAALSSSSVASEATTSFQPLTFNNSDGGGNKRQVGGGGGGGGSRAAQLFDFDRPSHTSMGQYSSVGDPSSAVRAARDFLGGWRSFSSHQLPSSQPVSTDHDDSSKTHSSTQDSNLSGTGFSLSKSVGWLIGDNP